MKRLASFLIVIAMAATISASAGPALAQITSAEASSTDPCVAASAILQQLPTPSASATFVPASATPGITMPTSYTDTLVPGRGIETSSGTLVGGTTVGASFIGEGVGDLPGVLVTSLNYTPPFPGPGVTNNIVGGQWVLCGAWGRVFGSFTDGRVQWSADTTRPEGTLADVVANMSISGGSVNGMAVSSSGAGTFSGVLDHRPLDQGLPPTVSGTLQLQASAGPPASAALAATSGKLPNTGGPSLMLPLLVATLLVASSLLGLGIVRRRWRS